MKRLFFLILFILCLLSLNVTAEEYLFMTEGDFPMPYSGSIQCVNAAHGVYTAESVEDIKHLIDSGIVTHHAPMSYSELFDYETNDPYYS